MMPSSHRAAGITLGLAGGVMIAGVPSVSDVADAWRWLLDAVSHGNTVPVPTFIEALAFLAGAAAGSRAPDWLEIAWRDPFGVRHSFIPHRTLTHWPWPWLGLLGGLLWFADGAVGGMRIGMWLGGGFVTSGLLHIALDFGSPTGIPFANPFGKRFSLRLYRTGDGSELIALALTLVAIGGSGWIAA